MNCLCNHKYPNYLLLKSKNLRTQKSATVTKENNNKPKRSGHSV
jgi:hypothetical protein